jgi:hypothetical protein
MGVGDAEGREDWSLLHDELGNAVRLNHFPTLNIVLTFHRIAVISAIRTSWSNRPIMHVHDEYYMCKSRDTAEIERIPLMATFN